MGAVSTGASLALLPLVTIGAAGSAIPATAADRAFLLGIALITAFVPKYLDVTFAERIGTARTATSGAAELPKMVVIGAFAFGEAITFEQGLASVMILAAVAIAPAVAARRAPPRSGAAG